MSAEWNKRDLSDKVAVVTGASRGAGRGIACVLGECGATVYVTGRSVRGSSTPENLPGNIDDTAAEVTARGGQGVAVRCDHTVDKDVEAVFRQVQKKHGKLDLLVSNAWGGYEGSGPNFDPFWKQPLRQWDGMFTAGVRAHLVSCRLAAPLMLPHERGLIVITTSWHKSNYLPSLFYDLARNAVHRMAYGMGLELRAHKVAAVAVSPGWMRTDRVMAAHAKQKFDLSGTESPEHGGRAIAHLAADPNIMQKSGKAFAAGDLAAEYGFTDIDGRQIPAFQIPDNMLMD